MWTQIKFDPPTRMWSAPYDCYMSFIPIPDPDKRAVRLDGGDQVNFLETVDELWVLRRP